MTRETPDLQTITERLERTERENRALKRVGVAALAIIAGVLLMGQAAPIPRVIEAQKFVLKDSSGRVRADLSLLPGGPTLQLYDANGRPRAAVYESNDGPGLLLSDENEKSGVNLTINRDGPTMEFSDSNGRVRADLEAPMAGAAMHFYDADGQVRARFADIAKGPSLLLQNVNSEVSFGVPDLGPVLLLSDENVKEMLHVDRQTPMLLLQDASGFSATVGGADLNSSSTGAKERTSAASIVMFRPDGKLIWQAPENH